MYVQIFERSCIKVHSKAWLLMHELKKYFLLTLFIKLVIYIDENYMGYRGKKSNFE